MEIGELLLENEVLEHEVSKLEEENQGLLMQLVQSQSIVHMYIVNIFRHLPKERQ